jgi:hypothetical protein
VRHLYSAVGEQVPIIGVGGIFTADDAYEKIKAGASAVQIYTGFVYEGPAAVKRINQGLIRLMERDGFESISEAQTVQNVSSHCSSTFLCPLAPMLDSRSTALHHSIIPSLQFLRGLMRLRANTPILFEQFP